MDWQILTTFLILAAAVGILVKRFRLFVHGGKVGGCGSCSGCGNSANNNSAVQVVQLTAGPEIRLSQNPAHANLLDFHSGLLVPDTAAAEKNA